MRDTSRGIRARRWTRVAVAGAMLCAAALFLFVTEVAIVGGVSVVVLFPTSKLLTTLLPDPGLALLLAVAAYVGVVWFVLSAQRLATETAAGFTVAPNVLTWAAVALICSSVAVVYWVFQWLALPAWLIALVLVTLIAFAYPYAGLKLARQSSGEDDEPTRPDWMDDVETVGDADSDESESAADASGSDTTEPPEWLSEAVADLEHDASQDHPGLVIRYGIHRLRTVAGRTHWGVLALLGLVGVAALALLYGAGHRWEPSLVALALATVGSVFVTVVHLGDLVRSELGESAVLRELDADLGSETVDGDRRALLEDRVTRLAAQADVPPPDVRCSRSPTPVAAAVGYRPTESTLVVSSGLLDALDECERDAVLAHELAHVANYDAAVLTALSVPRVYARRLFGRYGVNPALALLTGLVTVTSRICTAVVARTREYAADDGSVAITGDPAALASALETLDTELQVRPAADLRGSAASAFAIVPPPWEERAAFDRARRLVARRLFGTHPPTRERVARLRAMTDRLERG